MKYIIDEHNVLQVVSAMYENVKSNQHRLDNIEPILTTMSKQVSRMDTMLIGNGFIKAVEKNAEMSERIAEGFRNFKDTRGETCPINKMNARDMKRAIEGRDWKMRVLLAFISASGLALSFYLGIIIGG